MGFYTSAVVWYPIWFDIQGDDKKSQYKSLITSSWWQVDDKNKAQKITKWKEVYEKYYMPNMPNEEKMLMKNSRRKFFGLQIAGHCNLSYKHTVS